MKQTDMEEDIRKRGMLYVQQQRFGKVRPRSLSEHAPHIEVATCILK